MEKLSSPSLADSLESSSVSTSNRKSALQKSYRDRRMRFPIPLDYSIAHFLSSSLIGVVLLSSLVASYFCGSPRPPSRSPQHGSNRLGRNSTFSSHPPFPSRGGNQAKETERGEEEEEKEEGEKGEEEQESKPLRSSSPNPFSPLFPSRLLPSLAIPSSFPSSLSPPKKLLQKTFFPACPTLSLSHFPHSRPVRFCPGPRLNLARIRERTPTGCRGSGDGKKGEIDRRVCKIFFTLMCVH
jgi:hypothetical protein